MAEDQVEQFERSRTGPLSLVQIPIRNHRILYIEDNMSNLRLIERVLAHRPDIQLISAMQGGLGIELAREDRPDLILLDLHLPDMPGAEVLRRLQEHSDTSTIPVVVISADATPGQIDELLAAGARSYLTKPLNLKQFAQVLEENLNGSKVQSPKSKVASR
jgi:CheY-like chemotaxis protein